MLSRVLVDFRVPVIVIAGNHDSPERLGFGDRVMAGQGLYIIGQAIPKAQPVVLCDAYGPVYFCPIPYAEPAVMRERLGDGALCSHEQALAAMTELIQAKIPAGSMPWRAEQHFGRRLSLSVGFPP